MFYTRMIFLLHFCSTDVSSFMTQNSPAHTRVGKNCPNCPTLQEPRIFNPYSLGGVRPENSLPLQPSKRFSPIWTVGGASEPPPRGCGAISARLSRDTRCGRRISACGSPIGSAQAQTQFVTEVRIGAWHTNSRRLRRVLWPRLPRGDRVGHIFGQLRIWRLLPCPAAVRAQALRHLHLEVPTIAKDPLRAAFQTAA